MMFVLNLYFLKIINPLSQSPLFLYSSIPSLQMRTKRTKFTKNDVRRYVFENARVFRREWTECGKAAVVGDRGDREHAALSEERDLLVIAAGGPAGGFGAVIPPWLGRTSRAQTVAIGACVDCEVP